MVQKHYADCFTDLEARLRDWLSPVALAACRELRTTYASLLERLARPPLTLLHGDFRLENLRFSTCSPVSVAAFDWQFVCRGRGAYDLAYFLALSRPPEK